MQQSIVKVRNTPVSLKGHIVHTPEETNLENSKSKL